jgi:hypothetical protein
MLIKSRRMRWAEHVTLMEEMRNAHKILVEKHEGTPDIVRVIKSRRMRRVGHVAHMGERVGVYRVWLGIPKVRDRWEDIGVGGRITSRWALGR